MDELLNNLKQLTEEEKKQVQQFLNKDKPSVSFSRVTFEHCVSLDGLALNIDNIDVKAPTLHIPDNFETVSPSIWLCKTLERIDRVWVLNNEKSCRIVTDAILTEVLSKNTTTRPRLLGYCEVQNDWEGPGFGYTGAVDYMFGYSRNKSVETMDSFLLIKQAREEWPDSAIPQVICEAGCLLKKRLEAGKKTPVLTPVFAVLTNGTDFRFFAIDTDGVVYASGKKVLEPGPDGTYNSSASLCEILRWLTWFITSIKSISPRASSEGLTDEQIDDSLAQLRHCFGSKVANSNKKLKIQK